MYKRRSFVQHSAMIALGGLLLPGRTNAFFYKKQAHAIGLQLFTLFGIIDDDVEGTLKKVAGIGYKEIESAFSKKDGYYGMKAKEFSSFLKGIGLSWKSHHTMGSPYKPAPGAKRPVDANGKPLEIPPMKNLKENMQEIVDDMAAGKVSYLVCSTTPVGTLEEIKSSISLLNKTAEACQKVGVSFAYHNHDRDFKEVNGIIPYEMMLAETDSKLVEFELDLAWAFKAGKNPVELFKQYPGRFPLWHVKDISNDLSTVEPVGQGVLNFKEIFANAKTAGMQHIFVEHDSPKDAFGSLSQSYQYLTTQLHV